jgi:aminopeptidase N
MLRYTIGDSLFFAGFKAYATDTVNFKMKNALTDDFTAKMGSVAGQDLTWFMDEWVKQPNHPAYQNGYNFTNLGSGNWRINFLAYQTLANTVFHKMPIVLKFSFATGADTTVRVMNDVNSQLFSFYFNRQPTTVLFDPNNDIVLKTATLAVGINNESKVTPDKFAVYQNYPNPFNPMTSIKFDLPKNTFVTLKVYDILGKEMATLINENRAAGSYNVDWNASFYPSGVYFYKLEAKDFTETKRMLLIK